MKNTVTISRNTFNATMAAMGAAVNHLEACEAGRIFRPFKSRSLPMLRNAIKKMNRRTR